MSDFNRQDVQLDKTRTKILYCHFLPPMKYTSLEQYYTWVSQALVVKNLPANAGDASEAGLILGLGSSPGEGKGNPL